MTDHVDFNDDADRIPMISGLVCMFLIGFASFGFLLATGSGVIKAYLFASLIGSAGLLAPAMLCALRQVLPAEARHRPPADLR